MPRDAGNIPSCGGSYTNALRTVQPWVALSWPGTVFRPPFGLSMPGCATLACPAVASRRGATAMARAK